MLCSFLPVADLWQSSSLMDASSGKLLSPEPSHFPMLAVYALLSGIRESQAFASVVAQAEASLLSIFGNTVIIQTPVLLKRFMLLPQPVLSALLQSPKLMADAEASVLLLVSSWLEQPTGQSCSEAEVLELQSLTRYSRLSRPYVTGLCE